MRRLPWHVALRADRKALLAAMGVAIGAAFTVVGFAVPAALEGETVSEEGNLARVDTLVSRDDLAPFDATPFLDERATQVLLHPATLATGERTMLALVRGPQGIEVEDGAAKHALGGPERATWTLREPRLQLRDAGAVDSSFLAPGWLAVGEGTMRAAGADPTRATMLVYRGAVPSVDWAAHGLVVSRAPGAEPFLRASAGEVATDLLLVVLYSSTVVALLAFEFVSSEVRERRREIGVLRSLGMRSNEVLLLLTARAAFIGAMGAFAGVTLGLVALSLVGAFAPMRLDAALRPALVAILGAGFVAAAVLGGALPAWRASRLPIRDSLEAAP